MPLLTRERWNLPLHGFEVLQITFAFPLDIVVYGEAGASGMIRLGAPSI